MTSLNLKNFINNNKKNNKYIQISQETLLKFEKKILSKLSIKYNSSDQTYNINVINNIIYNEKSHIVATFKDYLIIDDYSEFLKRYYKFEESMIRLPKFYEYYETYSKIYPNYTAIFEGKYIYRNIQRKQRMIDLQEQMEINNKNKNNNNNKVNQKVIINKKYIKIFYDLIFKNQDFHYHFQEQYFQLHLPYPLHYYYYHHYYLYFLYVFLLH